MELGTLPFENIHKWFRESLSNKYTSELLTGIAHTGPADRQIAKLRKLIASLSQPPTHLTETINNKLWSELELFIFRLVSNDNLLFVEFLRFVPRTRLDLVTKKVLTLKPVPLDVVQVLPISDAVALRLCECLQHPRDALSSFTLLVEKYHLFSGEMREHVSKCVKRFVDLNIELINRLIKIVLRDARNEAIIDAFLRTFVDYPSIIAKAFHGKSVDFDLSEADIRPCMPVSFIKLLILLNYPYSMPQRLMEAYLLRTPGLFFLYLFQLSDDNVIEYSWKTLLGMIFSSSSVDEYLQIDCLLGLLQTSYQHPVMLDVLARDAEMAIQWFKNSTKSIEIITVFLLLAQQCEALSKVIVESDGITVLLERLSEILSHRDGIHSAYLMLKCVIDERHDYPFCQNSNLYSVFLPEVSKPSYSYVMSVLPRIYPLVMIRLYEEGRDLFDSILQIALQGVKESNFDIRYFALSSRDLLLKLESDTACHEMISTGMACSCDYEVFEAMYRRKCDNLKDILAFFVDLSNKTPIVNDFMELEENTTLSTNISNASLLLWVKTPMKRTKVLKLIGNSTQLVLFLEPSTVTVSKDGIVTTTPLRGSIENWNFIVINAKPKSLDMYINMHPFPIEMQIGSFARCRLFSNVYYQSVSILLPFIPQENIMHFFALGPNVKRTVDNFIHLNIKQSSFVQKGFISDLYSEFVDWFDKSEHETTSEAVFELSICPPYDVVTTERTTRKGVKIKMRPYSCVQFFNPLEINGGLNLIIHLVVEALLKKDDECRSLAFKLLDSLLNRFPFVHQYFLDNHVYDMFSALNQNTCEFLKGTHVTNAFLLKAFLKTPDIFTLPFSPHNVKFLNYINAFQSAVVSISESRHEIPESLIQFCLNLTNEENKDCHAVFVFDILMAKHLQFSVGKKVKQAVPLLKLLSELLPSSNVQIELMLPAIVNCSPLEQIYLVRIFLYYLPPEYNYPFAIYLTKISANSKLDEMFYQMAFQIPRDRVTFIFLYYASHDSAMESLYALSTALLSEINEWSMIHKHVYEHLLLILMQAEVVNRHFLPSEITKDSVSTTPFGQFAIAILRRAIELADFEHIQEFFKSIMAIESLSEFQLVKLCFFIAYRIMDMGEVPEQFLLFVIHYGTFLFNRLSLIPHERSEDFACILRFFFQTLFHELSNSKSVDVVSGTVDLIIAFSVLNINGLITEELRNCQSLTKHKRFDELVDRLENPTGYSPAKAARNRFQQEIEIRRSYFHRNDTTTFLTLCCNSILYQSVAALGGLETSNDTSLSSDLVIEKWRQIFTSLMCPGSMVFSHCPVKYTVNESSTKVEIRRILLPLNPAIDNNYTAFWEEKYKEKMPEIRLTLAQVVNFSPIPLITPKSSKFHESVERLTGLSLVKGVLVLTDTEIKFYGKHFADFVSVKFNEIRKVRMTKIRHQDTGMFIDDISMMSYLFLFETPEKRNSFVVIMESFEITIENSIDKAALESDQAKWITGEMSTFDYLLRLNIISGRTWSDFSRFLLFPWIILDFSRDTFDLSDSTIFRDFQYPLFAQSESNRASCIEYYRNTSEIGEGIHYGNYASNINSAIYYLVRLEPYASGEISFQGGHFDHPDRTFTSVELATSLMSGKNCNSALELVPELFYMPEMFENINGMAFGKTSLGESIDEVTLPRWASSPEDFTYKMRQALESRYVSNHIHEWIDLIWGVRRTGPLAEERCNCLHSLVFDFNQDEYKNDNVLLNALTSQLHTCGVAPEQLFTTFHPQRKPKQLPKTPGLVFDRERKPTEQELKSLTFSCSKERWLQMECHARLRIKENNIDYQTKGRVSQPFSRTIRPIMVHHSRNDVVTAHSLPVLVHWCASQKGLTFVETLVGHTSPITSVFINVWASIIMSGHADGKISLFTLYPGRFVRVFECKKAIPVTMIRISRCNSDVIAFQETENGTIMSQFSINGKFLGTFPFNHKVKACDSTSFSCGTRENLILILTEDAKMIVLSARTLEVLRVVTDLNNSRNYTALVIVRNDWVLLPDTDGHITQYLIK